MSERRAVGREPQGCGEAPTTAPANDGDGAKKGDSFRKLYDVDWKNSVVCGGLGNVLCGRRLSDGAEVVVTVFQKKTGSRNELRTLKGRLKALQGQRPGAIEVLGQHSLTWKNATHVVFVLRLHGVGDIKSLFSAVPQVEGKEAGVGAAELPHPQLVVPGGKKTGRAREEERGREKEEADLQNVTPLNFDDDDDDCGDISFQQFSAPRHFGGVQEKAWCVGCYEVNRGDVIGRGRFGTVYRGRHRSEGYEVAVKVIIGPAKKLTKLHMEAETLRSLQALKHPNILSLYHVFQNAGKDEATLVLVLELCRGGDLREFLAKHDPLSERQARRIMRQLVHFLSVLKEKSMMHRDLKPANILLTSPNIDETVVKVADWGMAKQSNVDCGCPKSDADRMFESAVGTVAYMSPERLAYGSYNFQAEVWALGVIMYELLFARHPYLHQASSVRTPEQLLEAIRHAQELELMGDVCSANSKEQKDTLTTQQQQHLSPEGFHLMRCMLDPDPKSRYTIEQVVVHSWFLHKEPLYAAEEAKAVKMSSESIATEAETAGRILSTTASGGVAVTTPQILSVDDDVGNLSFFRNSESWSVSQRQQIIFRALRSYFDVLRNHLIEEETDPGRGLVLLSYAWELFCAAIKAVWLEETASGDATTTTTATTAAAATCSDAATPVPPCTWAVFRSCLPEDIRQMETYIQDTAERLRRNLPVLMPRRPLRAQAINFSTASMPLEDAPVETGLQSDPKTSKSTYPTAHRLVFERAVSLISQAAYGDLMQSGTSDPDNVIEMEETLANAERWRRQRMYEQAILILRLFLQQVVFQSQALSNLSSITSTTDAKESDTVQVLTVPLVVAKEEADQRTAQALLHKVEKYYCRFVNAK